MTNLTIIKTKNGLQKILNEIRSTAVYNDEALNHREVSNLIKDRTFKIDLEEFFVDEELHLNLGSVILGSSLKMVHFFSSGAKSRVFLKQNKDGSLSIRDQNDNCEENFGYVHL